MRGVRQISDEEVKFGYYKVDCPFCLAPAGKRCQREVKHPTHEHARIEAQAVPHAERVIAWKEFIMADYDPEVHVNDDMLLRYEVRTALNLGVSL